MIMCILEGITYITPHCVYKNDNNVCYKVFITSIAQVTGEVVIKVERICQTNTDG